MQAPVKEEPRRAPGLMSDSSPYLRYQELQRYVAWTDEDAVRVHALAELVSPHYDALVDDFYAEIERHPEARQIITGLTAGAVKG